MLEKAEMKAATLSNSVWLCQPIPCHLVTVGMELVPACHHQNKQESWTLKVYYSTLFKTPTKLRQRVSGLSKCPLPAVTLLCQQETYTVDESPISFHLLLAEG